MNANPSNGGRVRWAALSLAVSVGALTAGCRVSPSDGPSVSGESHFLETCGGAAACAAGLVCACGVCTVACADDSTCGEAAEPGAICAEAAWAAARCGAGEPRICTRACAGAADCGPGLDCVEAHCAAVALLDAGPGTRPDARPDAGTVPDGGPHDARPPSDGGPRDARLEPDFPDAPAVELCPAGASTQVNIRLRIYDPATGEWWENAFDDTTTITGTVTAASPGRATLRPDAAPWVVDLSWPPEVPTRLAVGAVVTAGLGYDAPFWEEYALVVRDAEGLVLAAANGTGRWLNEPMWAEVGGFALAAGDSCAVRSAGCQDEVTSALVVTAGEETATLWSGQTQRLDVGGAPFALNVRSNFVGAGNVVCTDQPGSWLAYSLFPLPEAVGGR